LASTVEAVDLFSLLLAIEFEPSKLSDLGKARRIAWRFCGRIGYQRFDAPCQSQRFKLV